MIDDLLKDKDMYNKLHEEYLAGKRFTKNDLTKDILYTLAVTENISDSNVGKLFGLTIRQVRNLRDKYDLGNKNLKRMIDYKERIIPILEEYGLSKEKIKKVMDSYYLGLESYAKQKNWDMDKFYNYLKQKQELDEINDFLENKCEVTYVNKTHIGTKKTEHKRRGGRKTDQLKASKSKIDSGNLGVAFVISGEQERLRSLGLEDLALQVKSIYKTDKDNITNDGDGYDVLSFNDKGEPIYIEVKTSLTNKSDNVVFNISEKEVALMYGNLEEYDRDHAFIYYVYDIDMENHKAKIFPIDADMFSEYELKPTMFKVNEEYIEN